MIITLSNATVTLKDALKWGEVEKIQEVIGEQKFGSDGMATAGFSMNVMRDMQYKILEVAVTEVKEGDKVVPYTKAWVQDLSVEDAVLLLTTASDLLDAKKK